MSEGRLARWSPASGAVFVVLFLIGSLLSAGAPSVEAPDSKTLAFYADSGNQLRLQIGYLVLTLAGVVFIWFVGALWGRLRQVEREPRWLSGIVLVSGGAFVVLMLVGFAAGDMAAATSDHTSRFHLDPNTARLLFDLSYALSFETALPLAAPLVLAASLLVLRAELLPRWLGWAGWAGLVVALGCIVGFLGVPMALFLAWVLVVAFYLIRRGSQPGVPATGA